MHKNTFSFVAASVAFAQYASADCLTYSVEVFAGPDCSILSAWSSAFGIADNGAICGTFLDCGENSHTMIWWPNGDMAELPNSADGWIPHAPFELNSLGQVVGQVYFPGSPLYRAFASNEGITSNIGALPGDDWANAAGISSSGVVVGSSNNSATGPLRAFVWQNGKMSALPLPYGENSQAADISDTGKICG